jgi:hypothetical protein
VSLPRTGFEDLVLENEHQIGLLSRNANHIRKRPKPMNKKTKRLVSVKEEGNFKPPPSTPKQLLEDAKPKLEKQPLKQCGKSAMRVHESADCYSNMKGEFQNLHWNGKI